MQQAVAHLRFIIDRLINCRDVYETKCVHNMHHLTYGQGLVLRHMCPKVGMHTSLGPHRPSLLAFRRFGDGADFLLPTLGWI